MATEGHKSDVVREPVRRQVSFQVSPQHDKELDQKLTSHVTKPVIRQCSFQLKQKQHEKHADHPSTPKGTEKSSKKKSLDDLLPELMKKLKTELKCKSFIVNTRMAVDRKRKKELEVPEERQWMKGNEMQAFYHTWQTSDDHIKDQSLRPRTVRRYRSLPTDFIMTESAKVDTKKTAQKDLSDFGIVRECCTRPRVRIPSLIDHDTHEKHFHASTK